MPSAESRPHRTCASGNSLNVATVLIMTSQDRSWCPAQESPPDEPVCRNFDEIGEQESPYDAYRQQRERFSPPDERRPGHAEDHRVPGRIPALLEIADELEEEGLTHVDGV